MSKRVFVKCIFVTLIAFISAKPVIAENSKEFVRMAQLTWRAFECSAIAEKIENAEEQERLFLFGYEKGLKFIKALQSGKVEGEDVSKEVPIGVLLLLQGPTPDFMLGRIFENAADSAHRIYFKTDDQINSDEDQQTIANREFFKRNYQLIGK